MPNNAIIVLGMHRSGTSALTGMAGLLGVSPGNNLLPAVENVNPKGFWEHAEIVAIHNQLLEAFDSSWDDDRPLPEGWWHTPTAIGFRTMLLKVLRRDFGDRSLWLVKDPRLCRLLPLWLDIMDELNCQPRFLISLRNPAEVAHSLRVRDNLPEAQSCLLWLIHMLEAEQLTRGRLRAFVAYDKLLANWRETAAIIGQTLSLAWPVPIEQAAPAVDAFLDPSLRHHSGNAQLSDHPACHLAKEAYEMMAFTEPYPAELDRLHQQVRDLQNIVSPWSTRMLNNERENLRLGTTAAKMKVEVTQLRMEVARIKSTLSWQITKPLRLLWNLLRRSQGKR